MSQLNKTVGTLVYDNLIVDSNPLANVFAVKIKQLAAEATLKRGTVLAIDADGKMAILDAGKQEFNGDGTAKVFTVTAKPAKVTSVKVGSTASTDWVYDASTGKLTFGTAPAAGTKNVVVEYANIANCILADDVTVGTSADAEALAYRTGHFSRNHLIVATGYTLSAADIEALRDVGILISDSFAF